MRILIVGAIQGGTVPIGGKIANAFALSNQETNFLDYSDQAIEFGKIRINPDQKASTQFFLSLKIRLLEKVVSFRPDVIFAVAQSPVNDIEILTGLKKSGIILCYWFTEDYRIFDYWKSIAPYFDHFFTIQKQPFWDELSAMGLNNYSYLPMAFDDTMKIFPASGENIPVSFVGAPYPNRVHILPHIFRDIQIYGDEWSKYPSSSVVTGNRRLSEKEVYSIYLRTRVNINLHSSLDRRAFAESDFVNPRTFEIAGLGAFQLVDHSPLLPLHFDLNEEMAAFSNVNDMNKAVKYFLTHEKERLSFAAKARQRVHEDHTYRNRAAEIMKLL